MLRSYAILATTVILSISCSVVTAYVRWESPVQILSAFAAWLIPVAAAMVLSAHALGNSGWPRRDRIIFIAAAYFSLIVAYACSYYAVAYILDRVDLQLDYTYYSREIQKRRHDESSYSDIPRRAYSWRAFRGIDERLWVFKDELDAPSPRLEFTHDTIPVKYLAAAASRPEAVSVVRDRRADLPVFVACLHFSVATITTLGYGDIAANVTATRLAAMSASLAGIVLFVFALGIVLSEKR